ncbi:MAG TPA: ABC transporter substrate-binding protein [Thermoleophilia bacterium]|nr:ABC transporter substrate-binding protein [Thermoleophilia bacterium]
MHQQRRLRPFLVLLLVAAVAVLGLAWAMEAAGSESASPAADAGKVIYKVGWNGEPDNINPLIGYTSPAFEIWYLTYDSLVGYDPATLAPMKGEESTGLATDWSVSDDGLTWTFTIRSGVTWHDGQPLTARDVAFTYNYIIQNEMENWTAYTNLIETATATDDTTVVFECSTPKPDMIRHYVPILPEHVWSKIDPKKAVRGYSNEPPYVGSGPFQAVEWKKDSHVKLVANPDYFGGAPKIDELYWTYFTNVDTMLQDLKSGNIDGCVDLLAGQLQQLENEPGIEASAIAMDGFNELGFNCYKDGPSKGHPALKDWKFRQALNWAVDLQKAVDVVWLGYTTPGTTIIPPDYYTDPDWHWDPPADVKYTYDPEKAGAALDAAGYPDTDGDGQREYEGEPIELGLIARSESPESQQTAKLIAGWFQDVGIKVNVEVMDEATLTDNHLLNYEGDTFTPDYDMFLWGWYLDFDPGSMLSYFTKDQIENWSDCAWWDPEYEELYVAQGQELDPVKRKEYIDRMQQILYEQTPYIVTDYGPDFEAYNTEKWEGYIAIPDPNGNRLMPPFGNAGNANFLSIGPKTAVATEESSGGGNTTLWIVIAVAAVAVIVVVLLLVRRRPRAMEE